jgi:5-enolpyruvylshikimate-3-phosphate synthase
MPRAPTGPIVTDHDHRLGMSAHVLARLGRAPDDTLPITLDDDGCVDESWPGFIDVVTATHRALWTP